MLDPKLIEACKPQFVSAAHWWMNQLTGLPGRDAGFRSSDDPTGMMGAMMLMEAATAPPTTTEALHQFRDKLAAHIEAEVSKHMTVRGTYTVGTDYNPDQDLAQVADLCGISLRRFPIKTIMWVKPGSVQVRPGYGAKQVTVWPPRFLDRLETEFRERSKDQGAYITIVRPEVENFVIEATDRYENRTVSVAADAVLGAECEDEAMAAAKIMAEQWATREKIACTFIAEPGRFDTTCYDGKYYDKSGSHPCPACKGVGYTLSDAARAALESRGG